MSIAMLERAARELVSFLDEVAFLGGATVALWITDPAAPEPRPTKDVDVVVEVASRLAWHDFEERLRVQGLRNVPMGSRCRRRRVACGRDAKRRVDPRIREPLAATGTRSRTDHQAPFRAADPRDHPSVSDRDQAGSVDRPRARRPPRSHDLEDIINLIDGREEIVAEVAAAPDDLRSYLSQEIAALLDQPRFRDALDGTIVGGGEGRVDDVLLPRMYALAGR